MRIILSAIVVTLLAWQINVRLIHPTKVLPGCGYGPIAVPAAGEMILRPVPEVASADGVFNYVLNALYADHKIGGCTVHLRSYNGQLTGPTWRVKPGDVLKVQLQNNMGMGGPLAQASVGHVHGNSNGTNLHVHGLHVSPEGDSDNPLIDVEPGKTFNYVIQIPKDHPAGTHWYHPHLHGGTAVQQSSGMSGALIVEGGLDEVPEIKLAKEQVIVLQQFTYDQTGQLEDFDAAFGPGAWRATQRLTLVNGQIAPTIVMRPGEVQRWRIIQAGTRENVALRLEGHALLEIAADGIALGRMVSWSTPLMMAPGYREDVLVQADREVAAGETKTFDLVDDTIPAISTLQGQQAGDTVYLVLGRMFGVRTILNYFKPKPRQVLAHIVIRGAPVSMSLPSSESLKSLAPFRDITDRELTDTAQTVVFDVDFARCTSTGECTTGCVFKVDGCKVAYTINGREFNAAHRRILHVGQAAEWTVSAKIAIHPFHIHVNPFQTTRLEPDGERHLIWKDTIQVRGHEDPLKLRMRYNDFAGIAVLHCHILDHEDQGMMDLIEFQP